MTQSDHTDIGVAAECTTNHCHRVGVIEQNCPRREPFHRLRDLSHGRIQPQKAKNAGRSTCVADVDVDPVFCWDFDVVAPLFVWTCNGANDIICTFDGLFDVRCSHHLGSKRTSSDNPPDTKRNMVEAFLVDIVQYDGCIGQPWKAQNITC